MQQREVVDDAKRRDKGVNRFPNRDASLSQEPVVLCTLDRHRPAHHVPILERGEKRLGGTMVFVGAKSLQDLG